MTTNEGAASAPATNRGVVKTARKPLVWALILQLLGYMLAVGDIVSGMNSTYGPSPVAGIGALMILIGGILFVVAIWRTIGTSRPWHARSSSAPSRANRRSPTTA